MHNPFPLLTGQLLVSFIKTGHKYFVRQTYKRGIDHFDDTIKAAFLISHYSDKSKADIHFKALTADGNRFLYDINEPEHLQKLQTAAEQPKGFKIYTPLLQNEWRPTNALSQQIKKYIGGNLNWQPKKSEGVKCNLFLQFGELFLTLKWKSSEVKIPLSEVERL